MKPHDLRASEVLNWIEAQKSALMPYASDSGDTFKGRAKKAMAVTFNGRFIVHRGSELRYDGADLEKAVTVYNDL